MQYIPPWFPFANFRRIGAAWNKRLMKSINMPFNMVKADMVNHFTLLKTILLIARCIQTAGTAEPSLCARSIENRPPGITDEHIKWASGSLCGSIFPPILATELFLVDLRSTRRRHRICGHYHGHCGSICDCYDYTSGSPIESPSRNRSSDRR